MASPGGPDATPGRQRNVKSAQRSNLTPTAPSFTPSAARPTSLNVAAPAFEPMAMSGVPAMQQSLSAGAWQPQATPAGHMPISPADHVSTPLPAGTIPPRMPSPHLLQPATSLYGPSSPGASSGFSLSPRPAIRTPSPHTLPASASSLAVVDEMGPFNSARRHSYEGRRSKLPPVHTPLRSTGHNSKPSISFLRLEPPKPAKRKAVHVSLPIEANCSDDNEEAAKTKAQDAARQAGDDEDVVARKGREAVRRFKLRSQWTRRTPVDATDFALCDLQPNSADIVTRLAHPELAVKGLPHSIDIYLPSADEWNEQRPQMQPQGSPLQETILQAHDECIGKPDDDDTKVRDYLANSPRAFRRSSSPPGHVPRAMSLSIRPSGGSFASGAMSALGLSEAEAKARAVGDQSDDDASQNPRHQTDAASVKSTGASSSSTTGRPSWKDLSAGFGYSLQDVTEEGYEIEDDLRTNPSEDADASGAEEDEQRGADDVTTRHWRRDSLDDLGDSSDSNSLGDFSNPSDEERARQERIERQHRRRTLRQTQGQTHAPPVSDSGKPQGRPRADTNETYASSQLHPSPGLRRPLPRGAQASNHGRYIAHDDSDADEGTFGQRSAAEDVSTMIGSGGHRRGEGMGNALHFRLPSINNSSFGSSAMVHGGEDSQVGDETLVGVSRDRQTSRGSLLNAAAPTFVPGASSASSAAFTFHAPQGAPKLPHQSALSELLNPTHPQQGREKRSRKSAESAASTSAEEPSSPVRPQASAATIEGGLRAEVEKGPPPFNPKGLPPFFAPSSTRGASGIVKSASTDSDMSAAAPSFMPTWAKRGGHGRPGIPIFDESAETQSSDSRVEQTPTPTQATATQVPSTNFTFSVSSQASKAIPIRRPPGDAAVDYPPPASPKPAGWPAMRSPSLGVPRGIVRRASYCRMRRSSSSAGAHSPRFIPPAFDGNGDDEESLSDFVEDVAGRLSEVFDAWGDRILDEITRAGQARPAAASAMPTQSTVLRIEEGEKAALVRRIQETIDATMQEHLKQQRAQQQIVMGSHAPNDEQQAAKHISNILDTKLIQLQERLIMALGPQQQDAAATLEEVASLMRANVKQVTDAVSAAIADITSRSDGAANFPQPDAVAAKVLDGFETRFEGLDRTLADIKDGVGDRMQVALVNGILPHLEPLVKQKEASTEGAGLDIDALAARVAERVTLLITKSADDGDKMNATHAESVSTQVFDKIEPLLRNALNRPPDQEDLVQKLSKAVQKQQSPDISPMIALLEPIIAEQDSVRSIAHQLLEKHRDVAAGISELPAALNAKLDILLNARGDGLQELSAKLDQLHARIEAEKTAKGAPDEESWDKSELEELREQSEANKTSLEKANADLVAAHSYTKALKIEVARLEQFCTRADTEKEQHKSRAEEALERIVAAETRAVEAESKLAQLAESKQQQVSSLQAQLDRLDQDLKNARDERSKERESAVLAKTSLEERLRKAEEETTRLRYEAAERTRTFEEQQNGSRTEHQATLERAHRSEGEISALTKRLRETDEQVQNLRSVSAMQKQKAVELQQRLSETSKGLEGAQGQAKELGQALAKLSYLEAREKERVVLEERLGQSERSRAELLETNRTYHEAAAVLEAELTGLKGRVVGKDVLAGVQQELAASRHEVTELRHELELESQSERNRSYNASLLLSHHGVESNSFDSSARTGSESSMWSPKVINNASADWQHSTPLTQSADSYAVRMRPREKSGDSQLSSHDGSARPKSPDENSVYFPATNTMATPTKRSYQTQVPTRTEKAGKDRSHRSDTPSRTPLQSYLVLPNVHNGGRDTSNNSNGMRRPVSRVGSVTSTMTSRSAVKSSDGWWS